MDESEDKKDQTKKEPRCDPEQLALLKKCSQNRDITEWNNWRRENPNEEIWLQGATLLSAHLEQADLRGAHLEGARLIRTHLQRANLIRAYLNGTTLWRANLEAVEFYKAHLQGADFRNTIVDGSTLFWQCSIDNKTDFRGVGLDACRIDEPTKYLLEYNRRRMNCQNWYQEHPRLARPAKAFFWISDYGRSTGRIIFVFFALAFVFANIYYHWGRIFPPGIVGNLFVDGNGVVVPWWLVPLRTLYFSIATMTTLGFGDMFANSQSIWGHILLMLQVLLGYCLLGALITRFSVLFHTGLITAKFKDEQQELPK